MLHSQDIQHYKTTVKKIIDFGRVRLITLFCPNAQETSELFAKLYIKSLGYDAIWRPWTSGRGTGPSQLPKAVIICDATTLSPGSWEHIVSMSGRHSQIIDEESGFEEHDFFVIYNEAETI